MPCYMYILHSPSAGRYYVGSAEDVEKRVTEHNAGRVDSTKPYRPWMLAYTEEHEDRPAAVRREREIKAKKSRKWIEYQLLGQR